MKKYPDKEIDQAIKLREKEGHSFAQLEKITGIPATTIRNWCTDLSVKPNRWQTLILSNERKRNEIKLSESNVLILEKIKSAEAKIYAALLYACEGSKYPVTNKVDFTNSDPKLIKLFIDLLRKGFVLDENKFRVRLQIHDTHNFKKIKKFWHTLTKIPDSQTIKPTITKAGGKKHRHEYLGTCTIRYQDFRIQLKLIGIYEEFVRKLFNGEVA